MKHIKIQASAGSLKQLWNKLKYENRLDYYQPYSSFNYLPPSTINYPASYNLMNSPVAESSNLHQTVVSLPSNNPQSNNLPAANLMNNVPNLMTAESISNQNYVMSQMPPSGMQHLSPEFLLDYGQKPSSYSIDPMRNLNNLQSMNSGLSLTSLTPLLLLSSLGTLSSKSLAANPSILANPLAHAGLTPAVSNGFLKGLTTYLSSYLPSSPRQRKRQIDRNLPPALSPNAYPFKKLTPIESYPFLPLVPQPKTSMNAYDASFKYSHFNKKKPIKYTKPRWMDSKLKKPYSVKKKNQIKYSKLMNETGFITRPTVRNNTDRFTSVSSGKRTNSPIKPVKYSEPDNYANDNSTIYKKEAIDKQTARQEELSRSNDQRDKTTEDSSTTEEGQHRDSIAKNQPQTDNLEDLLKSEMYSEIIKRITSNDKHQSSNE